MRRFSKKEWDSIRALPEEGEGNHIFEYEAPLDKLPGYSENVRIRLVTRRSDGALGCAEERCEGDDQWFGAASSVGQRLQLHVRSRKQV